MFAMFNILFMVFWEKWFHSIKISSFLENTTEISHLQKIQQKALFRSKKYYSVYFHSEPIIFLCIGQVKCLFYPHLLPCPHEQYRVEKVFHLSNREEKNLVHCKKLTEQYVFFWIRTILLVVFYVMTIREWYFLEMMIFLCYKTNFNLTIFFTFKGEKSYLFPFIQEMAARGSRRLPDTYDGENQRLLSVLIILKTS